MTWLTPMMLSDALIMVAALVVTVRLALLLPPPARP